LIRFDPIDQENFVKYIEVEEEQPIPVYVLFFIVFLPFFCFYLIIKDQYNFNFYGRRGGPRRNYEKYSFMLNFVLRMETVRTMYV